MIYALSPPDEAKLNINEGVPCAYERQVPEVELWFEDSSKNWDATQYQTVLCYVDADRVQEAQLKGEYVHRINMGIRDAKQKGMPSSYVDKYLRLFIPVEAGNGEELEREAKVKIFNAKGERVVVD